MGIRSIIAALVAAPLLATAPVSGQSGADAGMERVRALLGQGKTDAAITALERIARDAPGHAAARNALGSLLNQAGRYPEALPHAEAAVALDPANGRYRYNRGVVLAELGRFAEAVADFDAALAANSDLTYAHLERGAALLSLGRPAEARQSWERAKANEPRLVWTSWYPATLEVIGGNYAKAAQMFDAVAAAEPGFLPARLWAAVAKGRTGHALAVAPSESVEWPGAILDYYRGVIDAERLLELAAQDRTSGDQRRAGEAFYFIGQRELIAGRHDSAAAYFRRALAMEAPRHAWKLSAERELSRLAKP